MLLTKSDTKENEHTHTQSRAHLQIHEKSKYYIKTSSFFLQDGNRSSKDGIYFKRFTPCRQNCYCFFSIYQTCYFPLFLNVISFPPTFGLGHVLFIYIKDCHYCVVSCNNFLVNSCNHFLVDSCNHRL